MSATTEDRELRKLLWPIVAKAPACDLKLRIEKELKRADRDNTTFRSRRMAKRDKMLAWANAHIESTFDPRDVLPARKAYDAYAATVPADFHGYNTFCRVLEAHQFDVEKRIGDRIVNEGGINVIVGVRLS